MLLGEWASKGVAIAYLEQTSGQNPKYYSCLLQSANGEREAATGKPKPLFRIELPGPPVLGDGKGDNQNCAIIYTRGQLLQAIDANQEGYLEESFKLSSALRQFESTTGHGMGVGDAPAPTIVGFGEHIFSGLGALGDFAASSELAFGTLLQSTMASVLQSRYHYGHPDFFDKFHMIGQGGISKATKKLNVSEDIFAGMDATLRGRTIVHREFYQVGKGRDMGLI